jgi:hypothetical protein
MSDCIVKIEDMPTTPKEFLEWFNNTTVRGTRAGWCEGRMYCLNPFTDKYWGLRTSVFMSADGKWVTADSWAVVIAINNNPTAGDLRVVKTFGTNSTGAIAHWLKLCLTP